jgi:hypothetical protein
MIGSIEQNSFEDIAGANFVLTLRRPSSPKKQFEIGRNFCNARLSDEAAARFSASRASISSLSFKEVVCSKR